MDGCKVAIVMTAVLGMMAGTALQIFHGGEHQAFQRGWEGSTNCVAEVAEEEGPLNESEIRNVSIDDCSVAAALWGGPG